MALAPASGLPAAPCPRLPTSPPSSLLLQLPLWWWEEEEEEEEECVEEALRQWCKCPVLERHPSPSPSQLCPHTDLWDLSHLEATLPLCVPVCKHGHTEIYLTYIHTRHVGVRMIYSFALRSSEYL